MSSRAIVPRCAVHTRGPCSPKRARSKMGYPAKRMWLTRAFRVGIGCFPDIARPPGHRLTPDRFHPPRKSSLRIGQLFLGTPHFRKFLKLYENLKFCPFRTSRDDFDRKQAPQTPESTSTRCARSFPTFPYFAQKVSIFEKMRTGKFQKNHPVTNRIQRLPIGNKFIRHREPPQIRHP